MTGRTRRSAAAGAVFAIVAVLVFSAGAYLAGQTENEKEKEGKPAYTCKVDGRNIVVSDEQGNPVWDTTAPEDITSAQILGDFLFVHGDNTLTCYAIEDGEKKWMARIAGEKELRLTEAGLFVKAPNSLSRFDMERGGEQWKFPSVGKIQSFEIFEEQVVLVRTDRRVILLEHAEGKTLVARSLNSFKYESARLVGGVFVLEFDKEFGLYDSSTGRRIAIRRPSDFEKWPQYTPAEALAKIAGALRASATNSRLEALATLHLMKAGSGKPWLVEAVASEDKTVQQRLSEVMSKLVEYARSSTVSVSETANAAVEGLAAMDASGKFEMELDTAFYKAFPEELPEAGTVLSSLIKMLRLGNNEVRVNAIAVLKELTGKDFGYDVKGTMRERAQAIRKWNRWYESNRGSLEWDVPNRKIKVRT
ncbi:MAG: PQQ-binding-like beta-propeller repeat protein [Planctomycetota bacterium]